MISISNVWPFSPKKIEPEKADDMSAHINVDLISDKLEQVIPSTAPRSRRQASENGSKRLFDFIDAKEDSKESKEDNINKIIFLEYEEYKVATDNFKESEEDRFSIQKSVESHQPVSIDYNDAFNDEQEEPGTFANLISKSYRKKKRKMFL